MILGDVSREAIDGDFFAAVLAVRDPGRDVDLLHACWNDTRFRLQAPPGFAPAMEVLHGSRGCDSGPIAHRFGS